MPPFQGRSFRTAQAREIQVFVDSHLDWEHGGNGSGGKQVCVDNQHQQSHQTTHRSQGPNTSIPLARFVLGRRSFRSVRRTLYPFAGILFWRRRCTSSNESAAESQQLR